MRPRNNLVLSAADITTAPVSSAIDASQLVTASVQAVVTGSSPVGTLKLQGSDDDSNPSHWSDISTTAVAATGTFLIAKVDVSYNFIRVAFAFTSGTGTVTAELHTAGI